MRAASARQPDFVCIMDRSAVEQLRMPTGSTVESVCLPSGGKPRRVRKDQHMPALAADMPQPDKKRTPCAGIEQIMPEHDTRTRGQAAHGCK